MSEITKDLMRVMLKGLTDAQALGLMSEFIIDILNIRFEGAAFILIGSKISPDRERDGVITSLKDDQYVISFLEHALEELKAKAKKGMN